MTPALVTLIALSVGALLGFAGVGAYRLWSKHRALPPSTFDHALVPGAPLNDTFDLPRPAPRAPEVAANAPPFQGVFRPGQDGGKKYPGMRVPETFDEGALRTALLRIGLPLRAEENPNPPPLPDGYSVMLLPMPRGKVLKVMEMQGIHIPEQVPTPDSDLRELLAYLKESDLISAWHGLEDIGQGQAAVQIQLNYEQATWWYAWLDFGNRTLAAEPNREGLHTW